MLGFNSEVRVLVLRFAVMPMTVPNIIVSNARTS